MYLLSIDESFALYRYIQILSQKYTCSNHSIDFALGNFWRRIAVSQLSTNICDHLCIQIQLRIRSAKLNLKRKSTIKMFNE